MRLERHDLLDVAPAAWIESVAGVDLPPDAARVLTDWCNVGRPVIVRRRLAGDPRSAMPTALQLPNAYGRIRVAVSVPALSVTRRSRLGLGEAAVSAPLVWGGLIADLLALGERFGAPAVYGGLLWQHVTGESTLRRDSDLDLVWRPSPRDRLALIAELATMDGGAVRVDGEIVLEDGGGVAWRELQAAASGRIGTVAVKTLDGVELRAAKTILHETVPC